MSLTYRELRERLSGLSKKQLDEQAKALTDYGESYIVDVWIPGGDYTVPDAPWDSPEFDIPAGPTEGEVVIVTSDDPGVFPDESA